MEAIFFLIIMLLGVVVLGVVVYAGGWVIRLLANRSTKPSTQDAFLRLVDGKETLGSDPGANLSSRKFQWTLAGGDSPIEVGFVVNSEGPDSIRFTVDLHPHNSPRTASQVPYRKAATAELSRLPQMVLRLEKPRDRWGAKVGLNQEAQIGDLAFDNTIYIESDAPPADIQVALADPRLRQALIELCTASNIVLRIGTDNQITATWKLDQKDSAQHISPRAFDVVATALLQVRARLPTFETVAAPQTQPMQLAPVITGLVLSVTSPGLVWLGHSHFPTVARTFYSNCLLGGLLFGLFVLLPFSWLYARGRSMGLRTFGILSIVTLVASPTTTLGVGLVANAVLDNSQRIQQATVASATRSTGDSITYHMKFRPWSPHRQWIRFEIPAQDYWAILGGKRRVKLTLGQGFFGAEWLRSYQLLSTPKGTETRSGSRD